MSLAELVHFSPTPGRQAEFLVFGLFFLFLAGDGAGGVERGEEI